MTSAKQLAAPQTDGKKYIAVTCFGCGLEECFSVDSLAGIFYSLSRTAAGVRRCDRSLSLLCS